MVLKSQHGTEGMIPPYPSGKSFILFLRQVPHGTNPPRLYEVSVPACRGVPWSIVVLSFGALTLYYVLIKRGAASEVDVEDFLAETLSASGPAGGVHMGVVVGELERFGIDIELVACFMASPRFAEVYYVEGECLFRAGDAATDFYLIDSGCVQTAFTAEDGRLLPARALRATFSGETSDDASAYSAEKAPSLLLVLGALRFQQQCGAWQRMWKTWTSEKKVEGTLALVSRPDADYGRIVNVKLTPHSAHLPGRNGICVEREQCLT